MSEDLLKSHLIILSEQAKILANKVGRHWEGDLAQGISQLQSTLSQAQQACKRIPSETGRMEQR